MKLFLATVVILGIYQVSAYRTYYVEDKCTSQKNTQKVVYNIAANGPNSVGEMRTNRFGTYSRTGRSCLIKLKPPKGYGVVVTIKKVDFRNHELCKDYIKIYTNQNDGGQKICRYLNVDNDKEGQTFFSSDKIDIMYHTEDGGLGFNDGFRLIFTVAKQVEEEDECSHENQFRCANSRCIWVDLTCDGQNNCGDFSDESVGGFSKCPSITPITIAVIALAVTTVLALTISICLCCCRTRQQAAEKDKLVTDFPSRPNGGYIPLPGYTYVTREADLLPMLYNPYNAGQTNMPNAKRTTQLQDHYPQQSALDLPPPYKP